MNFKETYLDGMKNTNHHIFPSENEIFFIKKLIIPTIDYHFNKHVMS